MYFFSLLASTNETVKIVSHSFSFIFLINEAITAVSFVAVTGPNTARLCTAFIPLAFATLARSFSNIVLVSRFWVNTSKKTLLYDLPEAFSLLTHEPVTSTEERFFFAELHPAISATMPDKKITENVFSII